MQNYSLMQFANFLVGLFARVKQYIDSIQSTLQTGITDNADEITLLKTRATNLEGGKVDKSAYDTKIAEIENNHSQVAGDLQSTLNIVQANTDRSQINKSDIAGLSSGKVDKTAYDAKVLELESGKVAKTTYDAKISEIESGRATNEALSTGLSGLQTQINDNQTAVQNTTDSLQANKADKTYVDTQTANVKALVQQVQRIGASHSDVVNIQAGEDLSGGFAVPEIEGTKVVVFNATKGNETQTSYIVLTDLPGYEAGNAAAPDISQVTPYLTGEGQLVVSNGDMLMLKYTEIDDGGTPYRALSAIEFQNDVTNEVVQTVVANNMEDISSSESTVKNTSNFHLKQYLHANYATKEDFSEAQSTIEAGFNALGFPALT